MTFCRVGIAVTLCTSYLLAQPSGHEVAHGQADVQALNHLLQIKTGDKAIINWKEFSNSAGEIIRFVQPSSTSAVLNRVTGGNTSTLYGNLEANGQVYLVNPNGIVIGEHARIDAGAFTASTFDVLDSDFLEGNALRFFGNSKAAVVNLGTIKTSAGDCSLISFQVENDGSINAAGQALLVASSKVILKPHDLQRIYIASDQDTPYTDNPYLLAFNQTIEKDALHFKKDDTGVFLMVDAPVATVAGTVKAESVVVLGDYVQALDGALIDVSSENGGGTILIGGDYQGKNDTLLNARQTYVAPSARLSADALGQGDGGKVIIWSDEATGFYGDISARGGPLGGNGGFVEVSGKNLDFHGFADRSAPLGEAGMLLLDPLNITIGAADSVNVTNPGVGGAYTFTACAPTPAVIGAGALVANLAAGTVTINTSAAGGVGCPDGGDITVSSAVVWGTAGSLSMIADRDIIVNASLQSTAAGGAITLSAGRHITITNASVENFAPSPGAPVTATAATGDITLTDSGTTTRLGNQFGTVTVEATAGSVVCQVTVAGFTHGAAIGSLVPRVAGEAVNGDVIVRAGTDVRLLLPNAGASPASRLTAGICRIGLFNNDSGPVIGNITVTAGRDIQLDSVVTSIPGSQCYAIIGQGFSNDVTNRTSSGNITVNAGRDLLLRAGAPAGVFRRALIGSEIPGTGGPPPAISSAITINVGRDMTLTNAPYGATAVTNSDIAYVGGGDSTHGRVTPIYANIGRDLFLDGKNARIEFLPTYSYPAAQPGFPPELLIHVGGDVNIVGGVFTPGGQPRASINFQEVDTSVPYTYELYAGGSIRSVNGDVVATCVASPYLSVPFHTTSIDIRAGGDLIIGGTSEPLIALTASAANFINLNADHCFAAGELWSAQSALINGNNVFTGTPLASASTALSNNGTGGFAFDSATYNTSLYPVSVALVAPGTINQTYSTSLADITIESADSFVGDPFTGRAQFAAGAPANFTITTATPNNFQLVTISGDIRVAGNPVGAGCTAVDSFNNITIAAASVATPWTTASIYVSANNDLLVNDLIQTNGAGQPITLIADNDDSGTGDLTLNESVISTGGNITLEAGAGAGSGSSAILQNVGIVDSNGGSISAIAAGNVLISGNALAVSTDGGPLTVTSNSGIVQVDQDMTTSGGNAAVSAGLDIAFTPNDALGSLVTGTGSINLSAGRDITIDGDPTTLQTTTGFIDMTAGSNISIFEIVSSTSGPISSLAGDNTTLSTAIGTPLVTTDNTILMITGNDMSLLGTSHILSNAASVVLVVDNDFPSPPGIGPGAFLMDPTARVDSGPGQPLQVFTALQGQNSILGPLNGAAFAAGTIFNDSATEHWCTYYPDPFFGGVFTVFYKNCEQIIVTAGNRVISDMLFNLTPENMWEEELMSPLVPPQTWRFMLIYGPGVNTLTHFASERYWLSRRNIHFIHYPYVYKEDKPLEELVPAEAVTKVPADKKSPI